MGAYYNDNEPYVAQWLRNLISAGHIAPGDVDERSIKDVKPDDLRGYTQCHFCGGIGGWPYAFKLAGWPDERPAWTASLPCQPLSRAGDRKGHVDERHIWPTFYGLVDQCQPPVIFGEQVASADGREWLAGIRADLEVLDYACGSADLCAAGVGSPHIRQRLYWVADANGGRTFAEGIQRGWQHRQQPQVSGGTSGMGNAPRPRLQGEWREYRPRGERHSGLVGLAMQDGVPTWNGPTVAIECSDGPRRISSQPDAFPLAHGVSGRMGRLRGAGNAIVPQVAAQFIGAYLDTEREAA